MGKLTLKRWSETCTHGEMSVIGPFLRLNMLNAPELVTSSPSCSNQYTDKSSEIVNNAWASYNVHPVTQCSLSVVTNASHSQLHCTSQGPHLQPGVKPLCERRSSVPLSSACIPCIPDNRTNDHSTGDPIQLSLSIRHLLPMFLACCSTLLSCP